MTIPASIIAQMATLGFSETQATAVASMLSEVEAATEADIRAKCERESGLALALARSSNADRQARYRERHNVMDTLRNVENRNETLRDASRTRAFSIGEEVSIPPENATHSTPKGEKPPRRATRLPGGWKPDPEMRTFALNAGLTDFEIDREGDKICDWSLSSKTGAKHDWFATWRGWVRRYSENRQKPLNGNHGGSVGAALRAMGDNIAILPKPTLLAPRRQAADPAIDGLLSSR